MRFFVLLCLAFQLHAINQTAELSPLLSPAALPFRVNLEFAPFSLPNGLHSFVFAIDNEGRWLLLAGRTNGLHGFVHGSPDNFPPQEQNKVVYVVDPRNGTVYSRSLTEASAGLNAQQIDALSVTSAQSYQSGDALYLVGGYGIDSLTGGFRTRSTLTVIDVPGLIRWVVHPRAEESAAEHMRFTSHPLLEVTGGYLTQVNPHLPFLLIFGHNFQGLYFDNTVEQIYTQQIRRFQIIDDGKHLHVYPKDSTIPDPAHRRRDLNVVPIIQKGGGALAQSVVALSGVFTETDGIWTVPVIVDARGNSFMPDPNHPDTLKQGMNSYACPTISLFSRKTGDAYILLLGGLSYLYLEGGMLQEDAQIPFLNQITTIKLDAQGHFAQHLMEEEYPVVPSEFVDPGAPLFFGANAQFIPKEGLPLFPNGVIALDKLGPGSTFLGYIVGGMQTPKRNPRASMADSAASPYIFQVFLTT